MTSANDRPPPNPLQDESSPPSFAIGSIVLTNSSFNVAGRDQYNIDTSPNFPQHAVRLPSFLSSPPTSIGQPSSESIQAPPTTVKRLKILCLDGGGYRGLSSLLILQEILSKAQPGKTPAQLFPHRFFDLICGTSTGGLIALLFVKNKMSIGEAIKTYREFGEQIFGDDQGFLALIRKGERFDSSIITDAIAKTVGRQSMLVEGDDGCRCFVAVRNSDIAADARGVYPIRSYHADDTFVPPNGYHWSVLDAARATSAAATYFLPLEIIWNRDTFTFEDAGMFGVNNPSLMAWQEIKKIPAFRGREIGCFLSLGTGVPTALANPSASKPQKNGVFRGMFSGLQKAKKRVEKLLSDLSRQATETNGTHQTLQETFGEHNLQDRYFRMNPTGGIGDMHFTEWFRGGQMEGLVRTYLGDDDTQFKLKNCAQLLKPDGVQ